MGEILDQVRIAAKRKGVAVELHGELRDHFRLIGRTMRVSYWPFSKNKTAYIECTQTSLKNVTPEQAVSLATRIPDKLKQAEAVKYSQATNRAFKKKKLKKDPNCHWCAEKGVTTVLTLGTATVDHKIPLKRGGLDNANNKVLSCEPCNTERGCDMTGDVFK